MYLVKRDTVVKPTCRRCLATMEVIENIRAYEVQKMDSTNKVRNYNEK